MQKAGWKTTHTKYEFDHFKAYMYYICIEKDLEETLQNVEEL